MTAPTLGPFEHQVLLAILRRGGESYSVDIVLELEEQTGQEVATAKVFVALKRLHNKGMLSDRVVEPGPEGGHARRYFKLTAPAREALRATRTNLLNLWDGIEAELDGGQR